MARRLPLTLRILYKSGQSVEVDCAEAIYTRDDGQVTSLTITKAKPNFLFAGIGNIEAIWIVRDDS